VSVVSAACEYGWVTASGRHPGRGSLRMRDMIGAVVILIGIIGVLLWYFGGCSFSPGGPTVDPRSAPSVDASEELDRAASSVDFAVREPAVPSSWRANSASTTAVGIGATASVVVRVGWVTNTGSYVQVSQSAGRGPEVVAKETGREDNQASGTVDVWDVTWTTYPAYRDESAWVTILDGVVVLVTGSGTDAQFRQLAQAMQEAEPLT
jgi:hypothetical protein